MNQSELLAITWYLLKAREKSRGQGVIGVSFAFQWLKDSLESFFYNSQSIGIGIAIA